MWAIARYDLGLSTAEFWALTPLQFQALRYRQQVEFRHNCIVAGIVAADGRNRRRTQDSDKVWDWSDFVMGEVDDIDPRREQAKQNIASVYQILNLRGPMTAEQAAEQKAKVIRDLRKQGFTDAEVIFGEVFPEG